MATLEINLDDNKIQNLLQSGESLKLLLEEALNQLLQAEITEHLQAAPGERTDERRSYLGRLLPPQAHHAGGYPGVGGAARPSGHLPDRALRKIPAK